MPEWPVRWAARWIWFAPPPSPSGGWGNRPRPSRDAFGLLRRAFDLDVAPARSRCRVTADARYVLWVNGVQLGRGPVRSDPAWGTYDDYDPTPHLRRGRNVFAALVRHYGRPTTAWRPAEPAGELGYGAFAFEAYIEPGVIVSTDDGWRAHEAPVRGLEPSDAPGIFVPPPTEGPPPIEIIDLRQEPAGWTEPGFDDAGWRPAVVLVPSGIGTHEPGPPSPFSALAPRPIPQPSVREVRPAALLARGTAGEGSAEHPLAALQADLDGRLVDEPAGAVELAAGEWATLDFGEIVCAHPGVVLHATPGTVVDLACGEDRTGGGRPVTAPREWAMRVVASGAAGETADSFEPVGFRYLSLAVRAGAARIDVLGRESLAPREPGASFACSDPLLGQIWAAGVRSLDLCSLDAFVDCPGREQRAWLGDAYLSTLLSLVVNPDATMPAWNLRLHAAGARPDGMLPMVAAGDFAVRRATIPDFTLLWVLGLGQHYERTGDRALVEELLPVAERALAGFERYRGRDGLLEDMPGWIFIDWAQLERGASIAALDAFHVMALDAFAVLAAAIGNTGAASRARARAARSRDAFDRYWDPRRGVYLDTAAGRRVSQQTNAVAILSGCAPAERWAEILERVLDGDRLVRTLTPGDAGTFGERISRQWQEPPNFDDEHNVVLAQPFFVHFVHAALVRAGRPDALNDSMRRWRDMVERGNGCLEEHWTAEPGLSSRCHAWSATPVHDLATYVLGVRPAEPGMRSILVEPALGDLTWAEGTVATPRGFVRVSVKRGAEPAVETPPGVRAIVRASPEDTTTLGFPPADESEGG